jgi:hypothetical protein
VACPQITQLAALTDRGKLQDPLVSEEGLYRAELTKLLSLIDQLVAQQRPLSVGSLDPALLDGDWELIYSTAQLFRSSPFFLAIERAYGDREKSELFFKLHELQTCSWGVSQVGRVAQVRISPFIETRMQSPPVQSWSVHHRMAPCPADRHVSLQLNPTVAVCQSLSLVNRTLVSEFDTVLLPLTTIPLIGWFKLLPTFGGRIITIAKDVGRDSHWFPTLFML